MEFELKITGSYLPDEPLEGKRLLRVDQYPSLDDHYLDIMFQGKASLNLYLVEKLLGNDIKVMTEPTGERPYDFPVAYDYIDTPLNRPVKCGQDSVDYLFTKRIEFWHHDNYFITTYFDYDTYGADKPVVVTFGAKWVLSRDLYNALMVKHNVEKQIEALEEEFQANHKPGDDETEFFKKYHEILDSANDPD